MKSQDLTLQRILMPRPEKLLIVDDEVQIRELLSAALNDEFSSIDFAEDGEEAYSKLEKNKYDIVITDLSMPKADGLAVLKKAREYHDDIIVLIMTGQASLRVAIDAVNLGADHFITKPFDLQVLLSHIKILLDRQRLSRENIRLNRPDRT